MTRPAGVRAFSATAGRFGSGSTDIALSQKLQEELNFEQQALKDNPSPPEVVTNFIEQGVWTIQDARGNDEVTLSRKYGDENIRIMFSISDIQSEEELGPDEEEGEGADESPVSLPIRASLSITKTNAPGALNVDMLCQDGTFAIENLSYYDDAKTGTDLTAEADWNRRGLYIGPQFDTLDVGVQDAFDQYLNERGVNDSVAFFIPEYASYKEQQEYVKWLAKVKNFVDL
jgi:complement component 1 Q subcomponent-binding protein